MAGPVIKLNPDSDAPPIDFDAALRRAIIPGLNQTPDQYSEDLSTAHRLGLPKEAVSDSNRADYKKQRQIKDLTEEVSKSDRLSDLFRTDPALAALLQDDAPNTITMSRTARELSFAQRNSEGVRLMQALGWNAVQAGAEIVGEDEFAIEAGKEAEKLYKDITPILTIEEVMEIGTAEAFLGFMKAHAGQQLPLMAPSFAGAYAGGVAGTAVAGPVGGAIGIVLGTYIPSFILGVGETQHAIKSIDPNTVAPEIALGGGAIIGALDSLLGGKLGSKLVKAFGFDVAQEVARITARNVIKASAKAGVSGVGIEGITEAIQEAVSIGAAALATDTEIDQDQLVSDMLNAFAVGAFMGGTMGTTTGAVTETIKARKQKKGLDALQKLAVLSKLRQRNAEKFGSTIGEFLRDGGVDQFIVDTDILLYWANRHPDPEILSVLQVEDQLDNPNVVLSPETFSAYILGTEHYEELIKFVHTTDGRSLDSVSQSFSNLEYIELLKTQLATYPISDQLREKTLKTLEKFNSENSTEIFNDAPIDVNAILNALMTEVQENQLSVTDEVLQGRINRLDEELAVVEKKIVEFEKELKIREGAAATTKKAKAPKEEAPAQTDAAKEKADTPLDKDAMRDSGFTENEIESANAGRFSDPSKIQQASEGYAYVRGTWRLVTQQDIDEYRAGGVSQREHWADNFKLHDIQPWEGRNSGQATSLIFGSDARPETYADVLARINGDILSPGEAFAIKLERQLARQETADILPFSAKKEAAEQPAAEPEAKKSKATLALEKKIDAALRQRDEILDQQSRINLSGDTIKDIKGTELIEDEEVVDSAIIIEGQIFTATTHPEALLEAQEVLGEEVINKALKEDPEKNFNGFVTNTGRFLTREEATELSGVQTSEDLAKKRKPKGQKRITIKAKVLKDLAVKSNVQAIRIARKAFREGVKAGKSLIVKKANLNKVLVNLPLTDKQKLSLTSRINNITTLGQFDRVSGLVGVKANALMVGEHRAAIVKAITKLAKRTKVKGKEGRFSPEVQEHLDEVRAIITSPRKTIEERRALEEKLEARLDNTTPDPDMAWKTTLYALLLKEDTVNMIDAEKFLLDLVAIREAGTAASVLRKSARKNNQEADIVAGTEATLAGKEPEMIDTSTLAARISASTKETGAIIDSTWKAWTDILDTVFNKKGVDDTAFIEHLEVTDEIQKWKAETLEWEEKLLDAYRDIYGLQNNNQALNKMAEDNKVKVIGDFQDLNGKSIKLQYSVAQIRKLWMERQDPTLRKVFEHEKGNAYTEQMMTALWAALDSEGKDTAFAKAQLEIYQDFYDRVNRVYRRLYGINLPFNPNYSPITRDRSVDKEGEAGSFSSEDMIVEQFKFRRTFSTSLLKRRNNELAIGKQHDTSIMYQHIHEMAWFIHMAEKNLHLKNVFKDERLKKAIVLQHGQKMMDNIKGFVEDFGVGHIAKGDALNEWVSRVNRRFAGSVLGVKPTIGIKQLTSYLAMADNIPSADFIKYGGEFLSSPEKIIKFLYENSSTMRTRGNSPAFELAALGTVDKRVFNKRNNKFWSDFNFVFIRLGDRAPIYMGGWAVYQHAVKSGKTHKQAIAAFERAVNDTQQSTDMDKLASIQRNHAIGRSLTMFMSARLALLRAEMRAWRQSPLPVIGRNKISWREFGKRIGYYHFVMPMFIQYIASGFKWEDDEQLRAAVAGQLNTYIIFGDFLMITISDILTNEKTRNVDTDMPIVDILNETRRGINSVIDIDWSMESILDAIQDVGIVLGKVIGKPIEQGMNILGGVGDVADGEIEKGLKRIAGFSEKVATESSED